MARTAKIDAPPISWGGLAPVLVFAGAWAALYGPVYVDFAMSDWRIDANAHQPFIMAIAAAVGWSILSRPDFRHAASGSEFAFGSVILLFALGMFAAGRLSETTLFVSASQSVTALGAAVALFGVAGAARLWFPLALTLYLIIWPGWALDALTAPLKQFASMAATETLYAAGLPIAHSGAVIIAGPYQLLVADACSGLNSLIALTATGAVYLYAARRKSICVNIAVLLALAPIAIFANYARVMILVLITYHLGYDAGQSFLHEAAGLVMFCVSLASVFFIDAVAASLWEKKR